jgi:hypothetical protein
MVVAEIPDYLSNLQVSQNMSSYPQTFPSLLYCFQAFANMSLNLPTLLEAGRVGIESIMIIFDG